MEQLQSIATCISRGRRKAHLVTPAALGQWAASRRLSLRQAMEAALTARIFPECWERNFPSLSAPEQLRLFQSAVLVAGLGDLVALPGRTPGPSGGGPAVAGRRRSFYPGQPQPPAAGHPGNFGLSKAVVTARHLRRSTRPSWPSPFPFSSLRIIWVATCPRFKWWWMAWTPSPPGRGSPLRTCLSAHNDVFGEIFRDLDRLKPGDEIILSTTQQAYVYVVRQTQIVEPTRVEVMAPTQDEVVSLISCYPYMVDNQRIVVVAELQGEK